MDLPDPLLLPISIVHCSREVFNVISCIGTELLYIGSSLLSCEGVHRSISLVISSLLLQLCLACLVRLTRIVFVIAGAHRAAALWGVASWTCSIFLAVFLCNCRQDFFSIRLVSEHVVHPYSSIETTAAWENYHIYIYIYIYIYIFIYIYIYIYICRITNLYIIIFDIDNMAPLKAEI